MKKNLILAATIFLSSCFSSKTDHCTIADKIMFSFAKEQKERNQFTLSAFSGSMMDNIDSFALEFDSEEKVKLEEARKLFIQTVENFTEKVNENKEVRPFLKRFPISYENTRISLSFDKAKNFPPEDKYVYYIYVIKGDIYYRGYDSSKRELFSIHQEPYEEALRIVSQASSGLEPPP